MNNKNEHMLKSAVGWSELIRPGLGMIRFSTRGYVPLYFFNVHDGRGCRDDHGTELFDLNAARLEAVRHTGQLLRDRAEIIASGADWHLEVTNDMGLVLFRLDVQATDAPICRTDPMLRR